jgi:peptidoglycan/xylan/chitin deacetylase (PgdA/CDA1 family)
MTPTHITANTRPSKLGVKRLAKISVLWILKAIGVFALARALHRKSARILCYHGVWLASDGFPGDSMFISAQTFERRMDFLTKRSFDVVSLDRAVDGLAGRGALPDNAVVITIDDGWYSTFAKMLPALKKHGMPATIYCDTGNLLADGAVPHVAAHYLRAIYPAPLGSEPEAEDAYQRATHPGLDREAKRRGLQELVKLLHVDFGQYENARVFGYMTKQELQTASEAGFDIELHTHTHSLHGFEPRLVEQEIDTNRAVLSSLIGRSAESFRHFCYPSGLCVAAGRPVLQRLGIASATTLESRLATSRDDPMFLPRILDGEHVSEIEFEAALCGIPDLIHGGLRAIGRQITALASLGASKGVYRPTAFR